MKTALFRSDAGNRKDKVLEDLSEMVAKAERVLKETGAQVEGRFDGVRARLTDAGTAVSERARHAADLTDEYVKTNPWKMLGVAAAAGVIVGVLLMMTRR